MTQVADSAEHIYFGQYTTPGIGITTRVAGVVGDPDANTVTATMTNAETDATIFASRACTRLDEGIYEVVLTSFDSQNVGIFNIRFDYATGGTPQLRVIPLQIGGANPAYDDLADGFKRVVEMVWSRFADLYDSPIGGPHLQVYMQTHFGRGRIAQLMAIGVGRMNTIAQPHSSFSISGDPEFPIDTWGALLEQITYVEVIKHLMRSYTEQPNVVGSSVTYLDRRDYQQRWQTMYQIDKADLDKQLETFKISTMGLGHAGLLVSGGVYGNIGPVIGAGFMASRPNYFYRFY